MKLVEQLQHDGHVAFGQLSEVGHEVLGGRPTERVRQASE